MTSRTFKVLAALSAFLILFTAADTAHAQRRRESRQQMMTKGEVSRVIKRVETRVDRFTQQLDRSLDHSHLNGTKREDWLNKRARDLESATDELRREFDRRDAWIENRDEVRRCLNIATDIDANIRRNRYGTGAETNWANVRYELNTLADIYNMPRVGAGAYK